MTTFFAQQFLRFAHDAGPNCRLRLAPTPSGFLHIGNALNFALNWLVARLHGGHILLRIDDLDAERKRPEYVVDVFESLEWLGLDWDEGPGDLRVAIEGLLQDFEKNWSQHRRLPLYFSLLERLRDTGLLFACRKSRRDLAPFGGDYPPEFREQGLSLDAPDVAWRIKTPPGFPLPDFVVRRRDGLPAYQLASLVDDIHFGITHVIRGADLETSTQAQLFLASCLEETNFLKIEFLHHPLIADDAGEKLSKSAGASALKSMRERGEDAGGIFRRVAEMLGWHEQQGLGSAAALLRLIRAA
ncbi:MAG: hypothetical protein KIS77_07215 [Saprospiraceae bacterium]|nr:hypothetical protein [Saprospiraceae bacterium]